MVWFSFLVAVASPPGEVLPEVEQPGYPGVQPEGRSVVGGVAAPAGNDDVVALAFLDQATDLLTVFCTGSVIQDDWILTAAHCIEETSRLQVPGLVRVAVWGDDLPGVGPSEVIPWKQSLMSPDYRSAAFTGDAGLVQLERPHPNPTWVVLRDEPFDETQVGSAIDVYGFGATGDGRGDAGVKRTTTLDVEEVDPSNILTFTPGTNVCSGDSGGPGFVVTPWGREQVGINAFVTPGCIGGRGGSTRVDQHIGWILDNVPGVALDPEDLPREEDPGVEDGDRLWTDFNADEAQGFAVGFEDTDWRPAGGCTMVPVRSGGFGLLLFAALLRRRRSASSNASASGP